MEDIMALEVNKANKNKLSHYPYQTKHQQYQNGFVYNLSSKATTYKDHGGAISVRNPKILLVEDTEVIQKVNLRYLNMLGCKAELAKDGFEAIEMFVNTYDLILLDIGLPNKNGIAKSGLDVIKEIRRYEFKTSIKRNIIIALTAFGDSMLNACMAAGCDDFYVKPLLLDPLRDVLQRWLPNHIDI